MLSPVMLIFIGLARVNCDSESGERDEGVDETEGAWRQATNGAERRGERGSGEGASGIERNDGQAMTDWDEHAKKLDNRSEASLRLSSFLACSSQSVIACPSFLSIPLAPSPLPRSPRRSAPFVACRHAPSVSSTPSSRSPLSLSQLTRARPMKINITGESMSV